MLALRLSFSRQAEEHWRWERIPNSRSRRHEERHEFARHLLENGIDPSILKRVLSKHTFIVAAREWATDRDPRLDRKSA